MMTLHSMDAPTTGGNARHGWYKLVKRNTQRNCNNPPPGRAHGPVSRLQLQRRGAKIPCGHHVVPHGIFERAPHVTNATLRTGCGMIFIEKCNGIRTSHLQTKWLYNKMIEIYWEYVIKFNPMKYQWSGGTPLSLFFATRQASEAYFNENVVF